MARVGAAAGLVLLLSFGTSVRASDLDYLDASSSHLTFRTDLNGIGQTFTATDARLIDASLMLVKNPSLPTPWVSGFRFEVREGLPGNFDGTSGNVLFQSGPIDIDDVPTVGMRLGQELRRLDLSNVGFHTPLALTVGQTYTLVLRDLGDSGMMSYAGVQPGPYPGGGLTGHNRAYANNFWAGPYPFEDMLFRVQMVPEPSSACAIAAAGVAGMLRPRRRRPRRRAA